MNHSHEKYINRCIELSIKAKNNGKYPVGSLIVKNGKVLAEAYEKESGFHESIGHAETIVILKTIDRLSTNDLSGCILYSTKEPCFMCSFLIRQTKISEVVFSLDAGNIGGVTSQYPILSSDSIENWKTVPKITKGVLKEEAERVVDEFLASNQ